MADAAWICQLVEHGLVRPSFVPPKPIRELRNLTRYRKAQIEERTRESQRLDKVLQDAGIKLSSVAADVLGVSGRAMLRGLVEGSHDAATLAELARGALRKKIPALREALRGRFGAHHALLVGTILAKLEFLDGVISELSAEIERVTAPFAPAVELLRTIPGVDHRTAEGLVAEIGVDMARFGAAPRLASWARWPSANARAVTALCTADAGVRSPARSRARPDRSAPRPAALRPGDIPGRPGPPLCSASLRKAGRRRGEAAVASVQICTA